MAEVLNENIFWKGFDLNAVSDVKSILLEQAKHLGKLTRNIVEATVRTEIFVEEGSGFMSRPNVSHCFDIITPLLGYRTFTLFCVNQTIGLEFPLKFHSEYWAEEVKQCDCPDQKHFEECLKKVLSSEDTTTLINSIIAQSA